MNPLTFPFLFGGADPPGQIVYEGTSFAEYYLTPPKGWPSFSAVAVGKGGNGGGSAGIDGGGGGGGAVLSYVNNVSINAASVIRIVICNTNPTYSFIEVNGIVVLRATAGNPGSSDDPTGVGLAGSLTYAIGDAYFTGGNGVGQSGGGASGYSGNGNSGTGGSAASGVTSGGTIYSGGGVGLLGEGYSAAANSHLGGSYGGDGVGSFSGASTGGKYGGGGSGRAYTAGTGSGGVGGASGIRIIWGGGRSFPNNAGDL